MVFELAISIKIIIIIVLMIVTYFLLKFFMDIDLIEEMVGSIKDIEFNWTALILTLVFSSMMWAIMWMNPIWKASTAFGTPSKIFLTIALPIIGYPLAVRSLNKQ